MLESLFNKVVGLKSGYIKYVDITIFSSGSQPSKLIFFIRVTLPLQNMEENEISERSEKMRVNRKIIHKMRIMSEEKVTLRIGYIFVFYTYVASA